MYVTLVQNISASTQSASRLCDSLKHLNPHQIDPFLSQNLATTCYSTLYKKQTLFLRIHLYEINTGPITYLIGAHRRQTPIAMLSHILHAQNSSTVLSHTCIYFTHCEEFIQYTQKKTPKSYIE